MSNEERENELFERIFELERELQLKENIIKEYIIINSKKVDLQEELNKTIVKQQEKIEKLNNIINNFEKWLEEYISLLKEPDIYEEQTLEDLKEVLGKLRELKGDSSNDNNGNI